MMVFIEAVHFHKMLASFLAYAGQTVNHSTPYYAQYNRGTMHIRMYSMCMCIT